MKWKGLSINPYRCPKYLQRALNKSFHVKGQLLLLERFPNSLSDKNKEGCIRKLCTLFPSWQLSSGSILFGRCYIQSVLIKGCLKIQNISTTTSAINSADMLVAQSTRTFSSPRALPTPILTHSHALELDVPGGEGGTAPSPAQPNGSSCPRPRLCPEQREATPCSTWDLGHWAHMAALDHVLKGAVYHCLGCSQTWLSIQRLWLDPNPAGEARVPLLGCTLPTARGGDPELLPASPATNTSLSHTWGEELWPHPNPAGSGRGMHQETSPCTEDKIDAKEPKAEAIPEFWGGAGDFTARLFTRGDIMRNKMANVTREKSNHCLFMQRFHSTGTTLEICFLFSCAVCVHGRELDCRVSNNRLIKLCSIFPKGSNDFFSLCWTASPYEIWRTAVSFSPSSHSQIWFKSVFLQQVISQQRSPSTDQESGSIYFISPRSLAKAGLV